MLEACLGVLVTVWLMLTAVHQFQFPWMQRGVIRFDRFMLLPTWTFFAPNPGSTDFRLVYRNIDHQDRLSAWEEVPLVRTRHWRDALWNPEKRLSKGLFDLAQTLMTIRRMYESPDVAMTSLPYVAIVRFVESLPRSPSVRCRQFMVLQTHGMLNPHQEPEVLVRSAVHRVA